MPKLTSTLPEEIIFVNDPQNQEITLEQIKRFFGIDAEEAKRESGPAEARYEELY